MQHCCTYLSPAGAVGLRLDNDGNIVFCRFTEGVLPNAPAPPACVCGALDAYFAGASNLSSLPVKPVGTVFQLEVWNAARRVPYGSTATYGQLAHAIGRPSAARAVAAALRANPVQLFVPCHRIIGADGSLTGFRAGLHIKKYLLELEMNSQVCF